jgi:hypothetical protein
LCTVECFYCCVVDCNHSVFLSVVVVSHEYIISSGASMVKTNGLPFWNYLKVVVSHWYARGYGVKPPRPYLPSAEVPHLNWDSLPNTLLFTC